MSEWKEYRLGDIYDVHNGLSKGGKFFGSGYPFLTFSEVFNNYFIPSKLCNLVQSTDRERLVCNILAGDIFITRTSETANELGMSCVALKDYPNATYNGFTKRLRKKENCKIDVDSRFIGYYLRSRKFRSLFYGISGGMSTRASLANNDLLNMVINLPSFSEQGKIGDILKDFDDKIAVNRRICENLEAQAQALFKHWFIDFAPFKNSKFVESELGMIPEGWRVGTLEEFVEIKYGKDHKKLNDGNIPAYGSAGLMRTVDDKLYDGESVLIPRKGTLNNIMYVNEAFWTVDTMFYTIPKKSNILKYIYMRLKRIDFNKMNVGTSIPSNSTSQLNKLEIVVPTDEILGHFDEVMGSLLQEIIHSKIESKGLATLRDTLLPKLMSGQIKV